MATFRLFPWSLATRIPLTAAACLVIADTPPPRGKALIERPTKTVVADSTPTTAAGTRAPDNPDVEPGLVKWHGSLAAAQATAAKSGKPVLLFQMMGYLDKKFC